MLVKRPLEKLLPKVENRYTLAILIAKRTRQLVDGALPLVKLESNNLVSVACEEVAANRVTYVPGQIEVYVPLRPEVEAARLAAKQAAAQADMAEAIKEELERAASMAGDAPDETDVDLLSEIIFKQTQDNHSTDEDDDSD